MLRHVSGFGTCILSILCVRYISIFVDLFGCLLDSCRRSGISLKRLCRLHLKDKDYIFFGFCVCRITEGPCVENYKITCRDLHDLLCLLVTCLISVLFLVIIECWRCNLNTCFLWFCYSSCYQRRLEIRLQFCITSVITTEVLVI